LHDGIGQSTNLNEQCSTWSNFLALEPVNCDFNHRGCVETVSRAKKFDHVEHCSFRLVDCPIPSCKVQIVKKKLIHHLKEAHGNPDTLMSHRTLMILFLLSVLLNIIFMLVYLGLDQ
jgi:hypothetical protein